jgi:hypothetical protein
MNQNCPTRIRDLPPDARRRAEAFLAEGEYYGWKLQSVATKLLGTMLQCTLDFDVTRIIFLARADDVPQKAFRRDLVPQRANGVVRA